MRHRVLPRLFALTSLLLLACTREQPSTSPDVPDAGAPPPAPPALSRFSAPIEYDFTSVLKLVEQVVPKTFGSLDSVRVVGNDDRKHYAFEAVRGPFTAFADDNHLHLRATIAYRARGFYKPVIGPTLSAGCGGEKERPRIVVELATPITLTPDYHLSSKASVVRVEPASREQRDHCDVTFLKKDVTEQVVGAARSAITSQLPKIDAQVAKVDLTGRVTEWWGLLGRPIRLADAVWLVIGPEQLRLGRVVGKNKTLIVPVSLDARPRIVVGPSQPAVAPPPLPKLGRDSAMSDRYRVILDGLVDYGTASRELTSAFAEKSFTEAGRTVVLERVNVVPLARGRLGLSVTFSGDVNGTLKLVGTPWIDRAADRITVPDLDFDLKSDDKLLATYSWLRSGGLRAELRKRARIPMSKALEKGRGLLLEGLNRKLGDAVTLAGTVDSVAARGLYVTRDGIVVRAEASGRAGMAVKQ